MSGVFTTHTAKRHLFYRVDQEVLQQFCCAKAHPFLAGRLQVLLASLKVYFK